MSCARRAASSVDELLRIVELGLRGTQRILGGLTARELRAVEFDEQGASFALLLLGGKLRAELLEDLPATLPHGAQLVEHQRRIGGLGQPQPRFQRTEHLLHAGRGALLLLDPVLEPIDLLLQLAIGLLQLRAIAKQREDAMIILGIIGSLGIDADQATELFKRFHVWQRIVGGHTGPPSGVARRGRSKAVPPLHAVFQPLV